MVTIHVQVVQIFNIPKCQFFNNKTKMLKQILEFSDTKTTNVTMKAGKFGIPTTDMPHAA